MRRAGRSIRGGRGWGLNQEAPLSPGLPPISPSSRHTQKPRGGRRRPPPAPGGVSSAEEFLALIRAFHDCGYTVVIPDVGALAPGLQRFARALEYMLRQPVSASLFWSVAGPQAVIQYKKRDNIIIQLEGKKRWYISTDRPGLQNKWKQVGEPLPDL